MDIYILFGFKKGVDARRILTEKFSNSDENPIPITVKNNYKFRIEVKIIDELPSQFQKRDFEQIASLNAFSLPIKVNFFLALVIAV